MPEIETCEICQQPRAKYGCRAVTGAGAYCQAPARRKAQTFPIESGMAVVTCSRCPAHIVWVKTERGRPMPVENDEPHRGESHFAHCPYASEFRKPKAPGR